jgi:hypothetical protein
MSLLVYNLTASPLTLNNGVGTIIPPSGTSEGVRGKPWYSSGNELQGRFVAEYIALQAQQDQGLVSFVWPNYAEYPTPGLVVQIGAQVPPPAVNPVLSATVSFIEPEFPTGQERALQVFDTAGAPFGFRILQVLCTVSRGAPDAMMYLCCHPDGGHEPHSDRFDASQPGQFVEQAQINERIIEKDEDFYVFLSTDYVLGTITMFYQRIS